MKKLMTRAALSAALVAALAIAPLPAFAETMTGVVEGTVTGPDGAELGVDDPVSVDVLTADTGVIRATATLDAGSYRIDDVPAGEYAVRFVYDGSGDLLSEWSGDTYVWADRQIIDVGPDSPAVVSAQLERGALLEGQVLGDGEPLANAQVRLTSLDGFDTKINDFGAVRTASDGTFAIGWIPSGSYTATVTGLGYEWKTENHNGVWQHARYSEDPGPPLVLAPGVQRLDADLEPWPTISGRATVRSGDVAEGASVNINIYTRAANGEWLWGGGNHWTAADGTFTIAGLSREEYRLEFQSQGAFTTFYGGSTEVEDAQTIDVPDGGEVTGIDIELEAKAGMSASIVFREDAAGQSVPLQGVEGSLWRFDEAEGLYVPIGDVRSSSSTGAWYSPALHAGSYILQFRADPYSGVGAEYFTDARYFYESTEVVVAAGEQLDLGEIVLEPRYFDVLRVAGKDRFSTSVEISRLLVPEGRAPVVYLTNGYKFPDALAAGPAAIRAGGVILATDAGRLPIAVADELARLDPLRVVILGDENTISAAVESRVEAILSEDAAMMRFAGAGRYDTGAMIVRDAFGPSGTPHAIIATGENYPDALAAAPAGAPYDAPVILVNGSRRLDAGTRQLLADLGITDVFIAGGPSTVSRAIESGLVEVLGDEHVSRIAGVNRYATAAMLNEQLFDTADDVVLATGTGFADALTGAPLAAALGAPLYLSKPACIPNAAVDGMLRRHAAGVWLLGGIPTLGLPVEELTGC